MAEELGVTIHIAGRPYRLFVKREEESGIRKATKLIEEQINHYASSYRYNDKQDLLAMVALHFASDAINAEAEVHFVREELQGSLQSVDQKLTEVLKD